MPESTRREFFWQWCLLYCANKNRVCTWEKSLSRCLVLLMNTTEGEMVGEVEEMVDHQTKPNRK